MMSRPLLISVGLHAAFAVVVMVGLPMIGRDLPEEMPMVRMEIVQTVPETNLIEGDRISTDDEAQEATVSKKPPPPPPPPPPKPAPAPPPPAPKPETPAPPEPEAAEVLPDEPQSKPELAEVDVPVPQPKPKRKPAETPVDPPEAKPTPVETAVSTPTPPPPRPSKSQETVSSELNKMVNDTQKRKDAATGVLQNLADAAIAARDAEKARQTQQRKEAADTVTDSVSAAVGNAVKAAPPKENAEFGIDDMTRISKHIGTCWSAPLGSDTSKNLKIDIFVRVDESGGVLETEVMDERRYKNDRTFKSFAISGMRAVWECSPLPIPANKYQLVADGFIFNFNPAFLRN